MSGPNVDDPSQLAALLDHILDEFEQGAVDRANNGELTYAHIAARSIDISVREPL